MFRQAVGLLPASARRRVVALLPRRLYLKLRSAYLRPSLAVRLIASLSSFLVSRRYRRLLADTTAQVCKVGRRAWLCVPMLGPPSVEEIRQRNLDLVVGLLARQSIEHFVLTHGSHLRHAVGVPARFRRQVVDALVTGLRDQAVYLTAEHGSRARRHHVVAGRARISRLATKPYLRVGSVYASPDGGLVLGVAHSCEVQFWEERDEGTLVPPLPNSLAPSIDPHHRAPARVEVRGKIYPTLEPFLRTPVTSVNFPIDVVYTWVDGEDAAWRAKKDHHLRLAGREPMNPEAANIARYLSRDELKYSLRSLETYASWVRRIFLVTDDQVPSWLNADHPRLRLVSHRDIFDDPDHLPTFNSHAIESRLHHIDGLSEQFLYLNDDVFFGRAVTPELFFHGNGVTKFFLSKAQIDLDGPCVDDPPVMSAAKNNRELIHALCGRTVTQKLKHVPHALRRDVLFEMEKWCEEDITRTTASRFRNHADISVTSSLHHYYAYCTGRSVPGAIRYMYTDLHNPMTWIRLQQLLRYRDFDVFCINDTDLTGVDADDQATVLRSFLDSYYPMPSSFERDGGTKRQAVREEQRPGAERATVLTHGAPRADAADTEPAPIRLDA